SFQSLRREAEFTKRTFFHGDSVPGPSQKREIKVQSRKNGRSDHPISQCQSGGTRDPLELRRVPGGHFDLPRNGFAVRFGADRRASADFFPRTIRPAPDFGTGAFAFFFTPPALFLFFTSEALFSTGAISMPKTSASSATSI